MTGMEFMARLAAIIAPPRYPLLRYAGVLGPRSAWRRGALGMFHNEEVKKEIQTRGPDGGNPTPRRQGR